MNDNLAQEAWGVIEQLAEDNGVTPDDIAQMLMIGRVLAAVLESNSTDKAVVAKTIFNQFECDVPIVRIREVLDEILDPLINEGFLVTQDGLTEYGNLMAQTHIMTFDAPDQRHLN